MSRSRYIYDKQGNLTYAEEGGIVKINCLPESTDAGYYVLPDIQPYRSMADGTLITSRSRHREHLKKHNAFELGNDSSLYRKPKPLESPPGLKQEIIRAVDNMMRRK